MPREITDVVEIQEVDLSPIELEEVQADGLNLRFKSPNTLVPELDDSQQLFVLKESRIGLEIFAYTRSEIIADVQSEIAFLWREYALADDAELSQEALSMKRGLLDLLEEAPHE